jgi:Uma2 family endonuclease
MGRQIEKREPATYDDVLAAPEHKVAELIDGALYLSPRPSPVHSKTELDLGATLRRWGKDGGWIILLEPELRLGANTLVPDLAGWRRERLADRPSTTYLTITPDWVCEVKSPSTATLDRKVKMPKYARAGVPWLWLIDPDEQSLEVFRLDAGIYVNAGVYGDDDKVRVEPFTEVELDLADLWRW